MKGKMDRLANVETLLNEGLDKVTKRLDAISLSISGMTSSLAGVNDRLTSLEARFDNVQDLIATSVVEEVEKNTAGIRDDINTLNLKTDSLQEQLESIKSLNNDAQTDVNSIMVKNFTVKDESTIVDEVAKIFNTILHTKVRLVEVTRFKAYEGRTPAIKVTFHDLKDKISVLQAKNTLSDYEDYKDV